MKTIALPVESSTLEDVLRKAGKDQLVFLTKRGKVQFAIGPADDMDQEAAALRASPAFDALMSYYEERSRTRPTKSLAEIREKYCQPANGRKKGKKAKKP